MTRRDCTFMVRGFVGGGQDVPLANQLERPGRRYPRTLTSLTFSRRIHSSFGTWNFGASSGGGSSGRQDDSMNDTTTDDRADLRTTHRVLQGGYSGGLCPREACLYTPPERPHEKKKSRTCRLAIPGDERLELLARTPPRNDPPVGNSGTRGVVPT